MNPKLIEITLRLQDMHVKHRTHGLLLQAGVSACLSERGHRQNQLFVFHSFDDEHEGYIVCQAEAAGESPRGTFVLGFFLVQSLTFVLCFL